jgi:lysozyme
MIPGGLKRLLSKAAQGGGAVAIAYVLVGWYEGRELTPYKDAAGIWTVCEGHTGKDVDPQKTYTAEECDALKIKDVARAEKAVDRLVKVPVTDFQKAALIDFAYNVGPRALATSTLLMRLNAEDYAGSCLEYRLWVMTTINGKKVQLQGLVNRADAREWLCLKPQ